MKLAIGNDHSALSIKAEVVEHLNERGDVELVDVGTNSSESFDYAISGYRVARLVADGEVDGGILICGTGVGISLAANKVHGIRACVCSEPYSAELSKRHVAAKVVDAAKDNVDIGRIVDTVKALDKRIGTVGLDGDTRTLDAKVLDDRASQQRAQMRGPRDVVASPTAAVVAPGR